MSRHCRHCSDVIFYIEIPGNPGKYVGRSVLSGNTSLWLADMWEYISLVGRNEGMYISGWQTRISHVSGWQIRDMSLAGRYVGLLRKDGGVDRAVPQDALYGYPESLPEPVFRPAL